MAKIKQRNWLLIITGCLVIASVLVLVMVTRRNLGIGVCYYSGVEYLQNELVPEYEGRNDCYCLWTGDIVCEQEDITMTYEEFNSQGLQFTYTFRNYLEKQTPDLGKVVLSDIKQEGQKIEIIVEREALCGEFNEAPVQTGMYKDQEHRLILTAVTNKDETLYSRVCLIANTFVIDNLDISEKSNYSIYYQSDSGEEFNLSACFVNGRLYNKGDVFNDSQNKRICTCEGTYLECEDLE